MSDQNDNDIDLNEGFDDFEEAGFEDFSKKGTLGDLWRNNPYVKMGIILAAFVFVVAGIILFGGRADNNPASRLSGAADVNEAPGSEEISQAYREAIEETNQSQTEQAIREDSSVVPMPVAPALGTIPQTLDPDEEEDPLDRWRRMQEERIAQQQLLAPEADPIQPQVDNRTPAVNALSESMAKQMESVLTVQQIKAPLIKNITGIGYLEAMETKRRQQLEAEMQAQSLLAQGAEDIAEILVPAGTIEYAQLITEANTDSPGPVLAQIQSGPLKGSRVLGSFGATEEYLTLNFSVVVVDGVSQQVSAVALDPGTTLPGMVTDIDRRYWKRIVLPTAASFVEGLAGAFADANTTSVTIIDNGGISSSTDRGDVDTDEAISAGVEEAGSKIATLLDNEASRTRPMLKIRAGTPIGVLFMTPVFEKPLPTQGYGQYGQQSNGFFTQPQQPFFGQNNNPYATQLGVAQQPNPLTNLVNQSGVNTFGSTGYPTSTGQVNAGPQ